MLNSELVPQNATPNIEAGSPKSLNEGLLRMRRGCMGSIDPIIDAIHRTRQQMAEKFGGDIAAILEDARKRQDASGDAVWRGPSNKKSEPNGNTPVG